MRIESSESRHPEPSSTRDTCRVHGQSGFWGASPPLLVSGSSSSSTFSLRDHPLGLLPGGHLWDCTASTSSCVRLFLSTILNIHTVNSVNGGSSGASDMSGAPPDICFLKGSSNGYVRP